MRVGVLLQQSSCACEFLHGFMVAMAERQALRIDSLADVRFFVDDRTQVVLLDHITIIL